VARWLVLWRCWARRIGGDRSADPAHRLNVLTVTPDIVIAAIGLLTVYRAILACCCGVSVLRPGASHSAG